LRKDENLDMDETENLFESSSDEVAAVFTENGNDHSVLRLSDLSPGSAKIKGIKTSSPHVGDTKKTTKFQSGTGQKPQTSKAALSDSSIFDDPMIEIDADENVKNSSFLTRRDSRNNMLNNTDSDDDMIIV
jgi:hypothetical protein